VFFALYQDPYHTEEGIWVKVEGLAMFLIVAALYGRFVFGQKITASPDGLLIQGMFLKTRVGWPDFQSVTPGYYGLVITRMDGSITVASAVTKANFFIWTKRQRRADRIANDIGLDPVAWTPRKRGCSSWDVHVGGLLLSTKTKP